MGRLRKLTDKIKFEIVKWEDDEGSYAVLHMKHKQRQVYERVATCHTSALDAIAKNGLPASIACGLVIFDAALE